MAIKEGDRIVKTSVSGEIYEILLVMARSDNMSLSRKLREVITDHLEIIEDRYLEKFADERAKTWNDKKALSLDEVDRLLTGKKRNKRRS